MAVSAIIIFLKPDYFNTNSNITKTFSNLFQSHRPKMFITKTSMIMIKSNAMDAGAE